MLRMLIDLVSLSTVSVRQERCIAVSAVVVVGYSRRSGDKIAERTQSAPVMVHITRWGLAPDRDKGLYRCGETRRPGGRGWTRGEFDADGGVFVGHPDHVSTI